MNDAPALNRVIRMAARAGLARASLEDDVHHFRIEVVHDGSRVTAVNSQSLRNPFTLCPAAGARLTELNGQSLTVCISDIFAATDARQQCTHQLDLAAFAIAAAARETGTQLRNCGFCVSRTMTVSPADSRLFHATESRCWHGISPKGE